MIKIGFYFDFSNSGTWHADDFLEGNVAMNGTDTQYLFLVHDLSIHSGFRVFLFSESRRFDSQRINHKKSGTIIEAIESAEKENIDVFIFLNNGSAGMPDAIEMLERKKIKSIMWDHNGPQSFLYDVLQRSSFIKRIVCVSRAQANIYRHRPFFDKVTYIYNAKKKNHGDVRYNVNSKIICFIGSITELKGFHHVMKAWPQIRSKIPDVQLWVIGSIKIHGHNKATGRLGIAAPEFEEKYLHYYGNTVAEIESKNIYFKGLLSQNEIRKNIKDCAIGIVNPNTNASVETFCLSALDFEEMGIPVIGGKAGGLNETINHGVTGILIGKPEDLANTVVKLYKDTKKRVAFSANCATFVSKNFSRKKIVNDWLELIDEVLQERKNELLSYRAFEGGYRNFIKELIRLKKTYIS